MGTMADEMPIVIPIRNLKIVRYFISREIVLRRQRMVMTQSQRVMSLFSLYMRVIVCLQMSEPIREPRKRALVASESSTDNFSVSSSTYRPLYLAIGSAITETMTQQYPVSRELMATIMANRYILNSDLSTGRVCEVLVSDMGRVQFYNYNRRIAISNQFYIRVLITLKSNNSYSVYIYLFMNYRTSLLVLFCLLSVVLSAEKNYTDLVKALQDKIQQQPYKHSAYERLAYIVDTYGSRLWGSTVLEQVIHEMLKEANDVGFEKIRLESVSNFTKWVRGEQSLTLKSPRPVPTKLDVIGLGGTVSGDIEAEVVVVQNYDQLEQMKDKVPGKIVCYNNKWVDYYTSVEYRVNGASMAAKYGAKAMLVRSVASDSISSVHTGYMEYDPKYNKIPCAAITVEDAEMFGRMQKRNQTIKVNLVLKNQFVPNSYSNNLVFEITGAEYPDQVVIAGGHIDSWDTGSQTGANDDGGGFITVFEAMRLLMKNGFRPKRTLRFVAWSGEESGSLRDGAAQYLERHKSQLEKHVAAFESDLGSTKLIGFSHQGSGKDIVQSILNNYLSILGASQYNNQVFGVDIEPLAEYGVPIFSNMIQDTPEFSHYFKYHHSAGDSMTMMDADDMDSNVVGIASLIFILADLETTVRNVSAEVSNLRVN